MKDRWLCPARRSRSTLCTALALFVAALTGIAGLATPASAALLYQESFTQPAVTHLNAWRAVNQGGTHQPCLTAATTTVPGSLPVCNAVAAGTRPPDAPGAGAFQLTDNTKNQSGALLLNQALDSRAGLHVEFDMFQYGALPHPTDPHKNMGADGISFFMINGAATTFTPGRPGGWLSYRDMPNAVVGLGFDQFGNFSNKYYWPTGDRGPGLRPNSVVVRGAATTNYQYIQGTTAPRPMAVGTATNRSDARRSVDINLSTSNVLNVWIDFHDGAGQRQVITNLNLGTVTGQPALPPTIKMGFGGATGDAAAYHEISNFAVTTLDPDLTSRVRTSGDFQAGGTGTYTVDVTNSANAGPTTGPVTTTFDIPAGTSVVSAGGNGWTCNTVGTRVTCTYTGTLRPGQTTPPVDVVIAIPSTMTGNVTATATVATPGETSTGNNTTTITTPIVPADVETSLGVNVVSNPNPYVPGGELTYTVTVTNDGPSMANDATVSANWPTLMDNVPWTCTATTGSSCPAPAGTGDISGQTVDVAPGGTVTFTVSCLLPVTVTGSQQATATVAPAAGTTDTNCPTQCTDSDVNAGTTPAPALLRKGKRS